MIMRINYKNVSGTLFILVLIVLMSPSALAHLMVAQHGTLNIVNDGAFMVLSLPISAFEGVDDDSDGKISMVEFNNHRAVIVESVEQNVILGDIEGNLSLQGIMLSPVVPHDSPEEAVSQLIVMGRFSIAGAKGALRFQVGLFGKEATEQLLKMTATHQSDGQQHVFEITPTTSAGILFSNVYNRPS
jgi:hypothetical protein